MLLFRSVVHGWAVLESNLLLFRSVVHGWAVLESNLLLFRCMAHGAPGSGWIISMTNTALGFRFEVSEKIQVVSQGGAWEDGIVVCSQTS